MFERPGRTDLNCVSPSTKPFVGDTPPSRKRLPMNQTTLSVLGSPGSLVPDDFVSGLEGVVAFTSDIAEPDKDGGALRYRGVDIEELVEGHVTFGNVWALLV